MTTRSQEVRNTRVIKNFYIIYTLKQLKNIVRKAKKKDGLFEQNLLKMMECKLPSFIYRSSFLPNIFESIHYIKYGNIAINKVFKPFIYYTIKIMDLITFRIWEKSYIYWNFYRRLKKRAFLFCFPKYMYISITFFFIICLNIPKSSEIINPIPIDFYKASSFSN